MPKLARNCQRAAVSVIALAIAGAAIVVAGGAARAQFEPVIAMSGRAGVPVIINGYDATGALVEGDWGLARPGAAVTIINPGPLLIPLLPQGAYYPATGRRPHYGRREMDFPSRAEPAEPYRRSWSAGSDHTPLAPAPAFTGEGYVAASPLPPQRRVRHRRHGRR